jgi:hypothetical protein
MHDRENLEDLILLQIERVRAGNDRTHVMLRRSYERIEKSRELLETEGPWRRWRESLPEEARSPIPQIQISSEQPGYEDDGDQLPMTSRACS